MYIFRYERLKSHQETAVVLLLSAPIQAEKGCVLWGQRKQAWPAHLPFPLRLDAQPPECQEVRPSGSVGLWFL